MGDKEPRILGLHMLLDHRMLHETITLPSETIVAQEALGVSRSTNSALNAPAARLVWLVFSEPSPWAWHLIPMCVFERTVFRI
jgi:hypothetical protein